MSATLIVMLVSEQTIPNVQFLKWYLSNNSQAVDLLFVSTKEMEEKEKTKYTQHTLNNLAKIKSVRTICVDENSLPDVREKLKKTIAELKYDNFVVNITGGTKIMSLAAYEYFYNRSDVQLFYQPIGQELQQLVPEYKKFSVKELLTLDEYIKAHGIEYRSNNKCIKSYEFNQSVYERVIKGNRDIINQLVSMQRTKYFKNYFKRKTYIDLEQISEDKLQTEKNEPISRNAVCKIVDSLEFDSAKFTHAMLRYITGGWLEEYVYQKLKTEKKLSDDNIALNVSIEKGKDKNELDVIYLDLDNKLHVIECKSFVEGDKGSKVFNDALYKLQAIIRSKFGLNAKPYLYTKSIVEKDSILYRAKEFGIEIIDGSIL